MYYEYKEVSLGTGSYLETLSLGVRARTWRPYAGDKNISILHLSCKTSDLQFSLVLQTHALVLQKCMQ